MALLYKGSYISGVSGDTKPTSNISTGTVFIETNTDKIYHYNGSSWDQIIPTAIPNASLSNSTVTIGDSSVALGATDTTLTGLTDIDLTSGSKTILDGVGSNTLTIGAGGTTVALAGNVTVGGTLTVNGATTTNNSTTVTIDDPIFAIGGDTAPGSADTKDRGIEFRYFRSGDQARQGWFGWDNSASANTLGVFTGFTASTNSSEVMSGTRMSGHFNALTTDGNVTVTGNIAADTGSRFKNLADASTRLYIDSYSSARSSYLAFENAGTDKWTFGNDGGNSNRFNFYDDAASSNIMTFLTGGKVGIGTTSPDSLLHIEGTYSSNVVGIKLKDKGGTGDGYRAHINAHDSNNVRKWFIGNDNANGDLYLTSDTGEIRLTTGGTDAADERMRITSAGNVGIGTNVPQNQLHVATGDSDNNNFRTGADTPLIIEADGSSVYIAFVGDSGYPMGIIMGDTSNSGDTAAGAVLYDSNHGGLLFKTAGAERVNIDTDGSFLFNKDNVATADFRIESANDANLFNLDAGLNTITMGGAANANSVLTLNASGATRALGTQEGSHFTTVGDAAFSNSSGTIAIGSMAALHQAGWTAAGATTVTNSTTLYIPGPPVASTNVTFTNAAYSLWVDAGTSRFDGTLVVESNLIEGGTGGALVIDGKRALGTSNIQFQDEGVLRGFMSRGGAWVLGSASSNTLASATLTVEKADDTVASFNRITAVGPITRYYYAGVQKGLSNWDGTDFTIGETSDYRLKENDVAISDGLTKINQLRPIMFNWKDNPLHTRAGFFAHEVQAIIPGAVVGTKDAVESNGDIIPQAVDNSKIVPILVAAIQELKAEIDTLKGES